MQQLYALEVNPLLTPLAAQKNFSHTLRNPYRAYLYMIRTLCETAKYVYEYRRIEESKYIQTSQVYKLSDAIAQIPFILDIDESERLAAQYKKTNTLEIVDSSLFRQLFNELREHPAYDEYIKLEQPIINEDHRILNVLVNEILLTNDHLDSLLEDEFITWNDDCNPAISMLVGSMNDYFKSRGEDFNRSLPRINWKELDEYGKDLVIKTYNKKAELDILIEPRLQNWDMERVNLLDLLLVRMTLSELLYFPSIPVKVSINEYVEVSKLYSTPKSREFINGILDRLMKELQAENKIVKTGRGLIG